MEVEAFNYKMNNKIESYLSQLAKIPALNNEEFYDYINKLDVSLPNDYIEFMRECNGGEGPIGENGYLILWLINELLENNLDYNIESFASGFFVFGKDAANTAFAFEKKTGKIYEFGFMADLSTDPAKYCGDNFKDFLEYLYKL